MIEYIIPIRFILALLIGAIIGFERESSGHGDAQGSPGGIRTYAILALLGAFSGFLLVNQIMPMAIAIMATVFSLIIGYYLATAFGEKKFGLTTEFTLVSTFILGFMVMIESFPPQLLVALLVLILLILSLKSKKEKLIGGLSRQEIDSFISYALIALVIYPILPNNPITVSEIPFIHTFLSGYGVDLGKFATMEILNPRRLWFIIALVTGIDVFGYLLSKVFSQKKSFMIASFVGGFISSTSTTQSLAQRTQRTKMIYSLVAAAIVANLASFLQVFLLVGPINSQWLVKITPALMLMIVSSAILAFFYLQKKDNESQGEENLEKVEDKRSIFSLKPAIKFALLLVVVKIVTKVCLIVFGQSGFIISSVIASFAGIDAIVINLADMAGGAITLQMALLTFLLVNATNLISKAIYVFAQAKRKFAWHFAIAILIVIVSSFIGLI